MGTGADSDLQHSREYEMRNYLSSMQAMYDSALKQNGENYDITFALTAGFASITGAAIVEDSRVIKTLRYAIAPTISQMKFGQMFGLSSIETLEAKRVAPKSSKHKLLAKLADDIARFATEHLDRGRFIWLTDASNDTALARHYAKNWTCSLAADHNAQTNYRNWRKAQQELLVSQALLAQGYVKSRFMGTISKATDLNIGEFVAETKVRGRTVQKADLAFRHKETKRLVLVEAKTVGVEIDATKRTKECCDKANDWRANPELGDPDVVAVIAGFFHQRNLDNLMASAIRVLWEHKLVTLSILARS